MSITDMVFGGSVGSAGMVSTAGITGTNGILQQNLNYCSFHGMFYGSTCNMCWVAINSISKSQVLSNPVKPVNKKLLLTVRK